MREPIVSNKYAEALLAVAKVQGQMDPIEMEIRQLSPIFAEKQPLRRFLEGPQITDEAKFAVIGKTLQSRISVTLYQFLMIVLRKHRISLISDIFSEYLKMVDVERGIEEAKVTTAVSMDTLTVDKLRNRLEGLTHKKIRILPRVDSRILGGVIVQIDNTLIDGSFRTQLAELREDLLNIKVY